MDIPRISMEMAAAKTSQSVGIAVMKNIKEMAEVQGEQIVQMMESIPTPKDYTVDIKV